MDCKQCAEELTAFLDGEISKSDAEKVRSHLDTCLSCSEELTSLRETAGFVESHNRKLEPRPEAWNLVRARIMTEKVEAPSGLFRHWRLALAALAVVAAFSFGYIQYRQIQARDISSYMSQYVQQREAEIKAHSLPVDIRIDADSPYANNPFVEIKATVSDNPFRSED